MTQPLLSILIPITPNRKNVVQSLINKLGYSIGLDAFADDGTWLRGWNDTEHFKTELWIYQDNKEATIGEKRDSLYKVANGKFSWQIDSDDDIADNAIELILEAIKSNPEIPCITFKENCMMNGVYKSSNHSIKYERWQDNFDGYSYVRCPFYKDVIRTDIAKSVPFPKIRYNEDEQWSMAIKHLLTEEIHIEKELYFYKYEPKESHAERYGITYAKFEQALSDFIKD